LNVAAVWFGGKQNWWFPVCFSIANFNVTIYLLLSFQLLP